MSKVGEGGWGRLSDKLIAQWSVLDQYWIDYIFK